MRRARSSRRSRRRCGWGDETGVEAIGGDPLSLQPASKFAREKNVAKLGAAIGFHGFKILCQLQIVEIEPSSLVRGRSRVDDARRRRGQEPFAQPFGDNKICHVVQCESAFEAIFGEPAAGENRPRVIDQGIDARFLAGDFCGHALHLGDACQIGVMDPVSEARCFFVKPCEGHPLQSSSALPSAQTDMVGLQVPSR
jgi:hypothetical protein